MERLNLCLFGPGVITIDGRSLRPHSAKALALLAILIVESDRPHGRAGLAELLWGPWSAASSKHSLRQALHSLKGLGSGQLGDCVSADQDRLLFVPGPCVDVDVHRFLACAGGAEPGQWREAASLYRAPLLEGRSFDAPEAFADWLDVARTRLQALATHNLDRLVIDDVARSDWNAALVDATALRDLDPGNEGASRHLMRIFAARGESLAIEGEWSRLRTVLSRDFAAAPSAQSETLYRRLRGASRGSVVGTGGSSRDPSIDSGGPRGRIVPRPAPDAESFVRAARAAEAVHAYGNAVDLYDRALTLQRQPCRNAAARLCDVLLLKEMALERLGRRAEQSTTLDEAAAIAASLDDPAMLATVLLRQAGVLAYLGQHAAASAAAQRALAVHRAGHDRPGEAEALRELGFVHWRAEEHAAALGYAREALDLHRQLGDVAGEASALHNLAEIHRSLGSPGQAVEWYERALQLHWACRHHEGEILSLFGLANALEQSADLPGSRRQYEAALRASERHGDRTMQSRALHALAMQSCGQGDLDTGLATLLRAVAIDRSIGYAHALGHDLLDLSSVHLLRRERIQARATMEEALVWFTCTEDHDATAATRARLDAFDAGDSGTAGDGGTTGDAADEAAPRAATGRSRIKSHLPLAEGKVYCAFESPLAARRPT
jgi:DNA-binding SARP family transcriptional activator